MIIDKEHAIKSVYHGLLLFEDIFDEMRPETEKDYRSHISWLMREFSRRWDNDIMSRLMFLYVNGSNIEHEVVVCTIFNIIKKIESWQDDRNGGADNGDAVL